MFFNKKPPFHAERAAKNDKNNRKKHHILSRERRAYRITTIHIANKKSAATAGHSLRNHGRDLTTGTGTSFCRSMTAARLSYLARYVSTVSCTVEKCSLITHLSVRSTLPTASRYTVTLSCRRKVSVLFLVITRVSVSKRVTYILSRTTSVRAT